MAESGAHITALVSARPSIFEVVAQESLADGLRSACKHLFRILAEYNPARFAFFFRHFEELYSLTDLYVQYTYLRIYSASFAEQFYGLKRVSPCSSWATKSTNSTSKALFYKSLLLVVGMPYLRERLDNIYHQLKEEDTRISSGTSRIQTVKKHLCKIYLSMYPVIHFLWESATLGYYLAYISKKTNFHSPVMHLSGSALTTITKDDAKQFDEKLESAWDKREARWTNLPSDVCNTMGKYLITGLSTSLSLGAFFLQFLNWWYSRDDAPPNLAPLPVPPPPQKLPVEHSPSICPLCQRKRTNDTVLASSGFVFCYPCIHSHLSQHQSCPVTGYPSTAKQLIKLYPTDV